MSVKDYKSYYQKNKEAFRKSCKKRRNYISIWFFKLKQNMCCKNCGENHPACLDFHHREAADKKYEITRLVNHGAAKETILK